MKQEVFAESPFDILASRETAQCWAGRHEVLGAFKRLRDSIYNRPSSTVDLVWANLGAGKTHALFHLQKLLEDPEEGVIVAYLELPEGLTKFLDLYRSVVAALPIDRISTLIAEAPIARGGISESLQRAARVIASGESVERNVALDWLSAGKPHLKELRNLVGIDRRIEDDLRATEVFAAIVATLAASRVRFVLLVDEFQRIGVLGSKAREGVLSSVRSIFSKNSRYFSLVVAAGSRIERSALELLPGELRTLMGMRPTIALPEMDETEAYEFILARFACFRPNGYAGDPSGPFSSDVLRIVIRFVKASGSGRLIPRILLEVCGLLYDDLVSGTQYTVANIDERLQKLSWSALEA